MEPTITNNKWADLRERPAFQTIFKSLDPSFLLDVTNADVEQDITSPKQALEDEENGTIGFQEDRGRVKGPRTPAPVPLEWPDMSEERWRQWRLRPTKAMRRLQIRRAMRLERKEQSETSLEQQRRDQNPCRRVARRRVVKRSPRQVDMLPVEMLMGIVGHTDLKTISKIKKSLPRFGDVLDANPKAAYHAILKTQYQHWRKPLGGIFARDDKQKANLKRAFASISYGTWIINARFEGVTASYLVSKIFDNIESDTYCPREYLDFVEYLEYRLERISLHLALAHDDPVSKDALVFLEQCSHRELLSSTEANSNNRLNTRDLTWVEFRHLFEALDDNVRPEVCWILRCVVCETVWRLEFFDVPNSNELLEIYEKVSGQQDPIRFSLQIATLATINVLDTIFNDTRGILLAVSSGQRQQLPAADQLEVDQLEVAVCAQWEEEIINNIAIVENWPLQFPDGAEAFLQVTNFDLASVIDDCSKLRRQMKVKQQGLLTEFWKSA